MDNPVTIPGNAGAVHFGLLGPVRVVDTTGLVRPVRAAKLRIVLVALLLASGESVSSERLADALWDVSAPVNARAVVRTYVARLRRVLGPAGTRVVRQQAGWAIVLHDCDELDLATVDRLWQAARVAIESADWESASSLLTKALGCWRGEPLIDVPSPVLARRAAGQIGELRLQLIEARIDADLRLGRHAKLVAELCRLVAEHPLREYLRVQLMLACYRCGNQAAALDAYRDAHRTLTEELGVAPGPELRDMHQRILAGDRNLMISAMDADALPGQQTPAGYRHGLPPDTAALIGRDAEIKMIVAGKAAASTIWVISGMPGVGKTALAVRAAHLLAPAYPNRQVFVDLHGHTPGRNPVRPVDALAELLAATGADARFLPADLSGRSTMWRDRLAGQRFLLVLDNAASSAQVTPLLPGSGDCLVLVTSRRQLADLPGTVVPVRLPTLSPHHARAMFITLSPRAASEDPALADELTELAGYLPLAVSLLARVHAGHPSWTLADLIGETRNSLLAVTAERASIGATFSVSWRHLHPGQRRLLALLSLHPGTCIDLHGTAALADGPATEAARQLDVLQRECLLIETGYRRYQMHDLIRFYAADQARAMLTQEETAAAIRRLIGYYTSATQSDGQALAWTRGERTNLLACLAAAATAGWQSQVVALTIAMAQMLRRDGPWPLAVRLLDSAVQAARELGDGPALARCLLELATVRRLNGDHQDAAEDLAAALDLYRVLGDQAGAAAALIELSVIRRLAGDFAAAGELARQALGICRATGDRRGEARALTQTGALHHFTADFAGARSALTEAIAIYRDLTDSTGLARALGLLSDLCLLTSDYGTATACLTDVIGLYRNLNDRRGQAYGLVGLGSIRRMTGDYAAAMPDLERAIELYRDLGYRLGQANALGVLGNVRQAVGDYPGAIRDLKEALRLYRHIGMPSGEAATLAWLGNVRVTIGDYAAAAAELAEALSVSRRLGDRGGEATSINLLARLHHATADIAGARSLYQQGLELSRQISSLWDEGCALAGLGRCAQADGDKAAARSLLADAHEIFERIGAAETAEIATELAAITDASLGVACRWFASGRLWRICRVNAGLPCAR